MTENKRKDLPTLYALDSKGKAKVWGGWAYENSDGTAGYTTFAGLKDGKHAESGKNIKEGKNIGRANQTSPYEQAIAELTSKFEKKCSQEGYAESEEGLSIPRLPMLAKNYHDCKGKVEWPCLAQIKLDGLRCIATKVNGDTIRYTSRKGLEFTTLSHLTPKLLEIMNLDESWDGELYSDSLTFQQVTAAIKKTKEDTLKIELWVYDKVDDKASFENRYKRYFSAIEVKSYEKISAPVKAVESILVHDEKELYEAHDKFVSQGFEGLVCRSGATGYEFKKRSNSLLKLKSFNDSEFKIVSGYHGSGSAENHVTFICVTDSGQEFGCVMRGSHEYRASLWKNLDKIVAAQAYITVKYFGLTDSGLPRFPVGLGFRSGAINKNGVFEPNF